MKQVKSFGLVVLAWLVVLAGGLSQFAAAAEVGPGTTTGWESEKSPAEGIQPSMGRRICYPCCSLAFDVMGDGKWILISGEHYGRFFGYYWDGKRWIPDRSRVKGLGDIGGYSAPAMTPKLTSDGKWTLIARNGKGKFFGWYWDGAQWVYDPARIRGLDGGPGAASLAMLDDLKGDGRRTLITGNGEGTFKAFYWGGNKWVSDPSRVSGLGDVGRRSRPAAGFNVFGDKKWTLIAGNRKGTFIGYCWDAKRWIPDPSRVKGLGEGRKYKGNTSPALAYNLRGDGKWVLIAGYYVTNCGFFCDTVSRKEIPPVRGVVATPLATAARIKWKCDRSWNHRVRYSTNKDMSDAAWSDWRQDSNRPHVKLYHLKPKTTYYYKAYTCVPWDTDVYTTGSLGSFTTSAGRKHIRLKAGESIQDAIESLAVEGGTVNLLPGVHDVHDTIVINRNNVTIQGAHDSEIRAHDPTKDIFAIPHENPMPGEPWDRMPVIENIAFKGFKVTSTFGKTRARRASINAWNVRNLTVEGILNASHIYGLVWVNVTGSGSKAKSKNILVKNNTIENSEVHFSFTEDIHVLNNTFKGPSSFIFIDRSNKNVHIIGNNLDKRGGGYACIVMDSTLNYEVRDNVCMGGRYGIRMGAGPKNVIVSNNTITEGSRGGIEIVDQYGATGTIRNNRIYKNNGPGIRAYEYSWSMKKNKYGNVTVADNIIWNNAGDGIEVKTGIRLDVRENIIANNQGYGISHAGTGKRACNMSLSGNNLWNNKVGAYSGVAAGEGDISKDPLFADPSKGDFSPRKTK